MPVLPLVTPATPDILVEDGDSLDFPGWDVAAIWTPGHSPGHLCLWEAANQLMLSGDHVLPRSRRTSPSIPRPGDNPLGDFSNRSSGSGGTRRRRCCPGHEHRFVNLAGRVGELHEHHAWRFDEVVAALAGGFTTGWEVATLMKWSRPWAGIDGFMRRAAVLETLAHLRALEVRGMVEEIM